MHSNWCIVLIFRCLLWAQASGRLDLYERGASHLYNNFSLCERHFEPNQFMNDKKKRLIWKAIPTIFEIPKSAVRVRRKKTKTRRSTATVRRRAVASVEMTRDSEPDDDGDDVSRERLTKVCPRMNILKFGFIDIVRSVDP